MRVCSILKYLDKIASSWILYFFSIYDTILNLLRLFGFDGKPCKSENGYSNGIQEFENYLRKAR